MPASQKKLFQSLDTLHCLCEQSPHKDNYFLVISQLSQRLKKLSQCKSMNVYSKEVSQPYSVWLKPREVCSLTAQSYHELAQSMKSAGTASAACYGSAKNKAMMER